MKQTLFMIALTLLGCGGSFLFTPFVGLAIYILYAVLRPQFLWQWSLPEGISWSLYVALATIVATLVRGFARPRPVPGRWPPSPLQLTRLHVAFLAFGVWIVLSYGQAFHPAAGEAHMIEYGKMYVMFLVGIVVIRTVPQVWILVLIYAVSLGYIAYEINFLYFAYGYLGIVRNGYGGHDNNGAGLLLALGVPLCACAWEAYRGWYRWGFALLIPVILHAVMMTYSRGAMLAIVLAAPVWLLRGRSDTRKLKLLVAIGVLVLIPFLAGPEIRQRFFSIGDYEVDGSAQSRLTSWTIGLRMAAENPLLGVGVRNSSLFTYDYGADEPGRVIHSQYIQLAADTGFVGLGLYLAVTILALLDLQKVIRAAQPRTDLDSTRAYAAAVGIQAAIVTFLIGAVFLSCEAFEPQYYLFLAATQLRLAYLSANHPTPPLPRRDWPLVPSQPLLARTSL
ncbi:MAG: O-antigen ligase family protein [Gemmataceae bacterium]|nr:O-antigen ligase family protein [Gemmata sp.]MDW8198389.1 O-antigen ligase family protein [Gemmataceae bacterium]